MPPRRAAVAALALLLLPACGPSAGIDAVRVLSDDTSAAPPTTITTTADQEPSTPPSPSTPTPSPSSPPTTPRQESPAPDSTAPARPCPPDALCLPEHGTDSIPALWKYDYELTIETNAAQSCVWVRGETDRMPGERIAMAWPDDHYARFDPLRVFNAEGTEIWRDGEVKYLNAWWDNGAYGYYDDDWPREHIPAECRTERVLYTLDTPHDQPRRHPNGHTAPPTSSRPSVITVP